MSLVSEQLPNLMNGVSQQAVTMRMGSQGEAQLNALSSLVKGNTKRPPTKYKAKISDQKLSDAYIHTINRDPTEQYIVAISEGSLKVFDFEGNEKTVNAPDGYQYLTTALSNPKQDLKAVTVADYTFIVNRNREVAKSTKRSPSQPYWAQAFLQALSYDTKYRLVIDGVNVATHTTGSTSGLDTEVIMSTLKNNAESDQWRQDGYYAPVNHPDNVYPVSWGLESDTSKIRVTQGYWDSPLSFTHDVAGSLEVTSPVNEARYVYIYYKDSEALEDKFKFFSYQSILHMEREDGTEFEMEARDNKGGQMFKAVLPKMESFTDLPIVGRKDKVVEIVSNDSGRSDAYYLKFITNNATRNYDEGYWLETVKPDTQIEIDPNTMPHVLVREADGSFTFRKQEWGQREVGDENSAPWPSFVGRKINDIYYDARRLCIVSDDNVSMSRRSDLFSFFPETVTTILDTGPIDVSASTTQVVTLKHAVPFNKSILFFADQAQFEMREEALLATRPPSLQLITDYDSDESAKPVGAGRTVFFTSSRGDYTSVLEYYVMSETETTDASDITSHVPAYIPSGSYKLTASESSDIMFVLTEGDRGSVYVYKYMWQGSEKRQSSWSKWTFGDGAEIYNADFIKDICYFIVGYRDGTYIESLASAESQVDTNETFLYRLDRRIDDTQVIGLTYDSVSNKTQFRLPYVLDGSVPVIATRNGDGSSDKKPAVSVSLEVLDEGSTGSGALIEAEGDLRNTLFFVGINYAHLYEFSQPTVKGRSQSGGMATLAAGRMQLKRWHVFYDETGYFRAEVQPKNQNPYVYMLNAGAYASDPYSYTSNGGKLGTGDFVIGEAPITSGKKSFRVNSKSDRVSVRLINDSFLPSTFTSAEWEARFSRNTSRG